jgi:hypothetical protein
MKSLRGLISIAPDFSPGNQLRQKLSEKLMFLLPMLSPTKVGGN